MYVCTLDVIKFVRPAVACSLYLVGQDSYEGGSNYLIGRSIRAIINCILLKLGCYSHLDNLMRFRLLTAAIHRYQDSKGTLFISLLRVAITSWPCLVLEIG